MKVKHFSILLFFLITSLLLFAQNNVSFKVLWLGATPYDSEYKHLWENNLTPNGKWIFQPGIVLHYEFFILELDHSIRFQEGILLDVAAQPSAFTHIGYRVRLFKKWRNTVNFGLGPTIFYRSSWKNFDDYQDHGDMEIAGNIEYKFLPIGFELEYDFYVSNKSDISLSFYYMQPKTISLSIGYKYWIHTKIKHKKKCNTCYYNR
ncbi:MAG: hypothetical protein C0594_06095 [Marinilabiliales bacterium]|nr:MAG: hypothetical protein C0594_06095 [Marinilabiliales bacterium]